MSGRGGKRAGSGRKKLGVIRKVSVNMPQEFWDFADRFKTFNDCIKELWKTKEENSNQNQKIDNGYHNQDNQLSNNLIETSNQVHIEECGNQNQNNEISYPIQMNEPLSDSEKRKITRESKYLFDVIGMYSDPTVVIVGKFDSIGPKLAPFLYEKLLTRKFDEKHLAAIQESWTQYSSAQQELEEFRKQRRK